MPTMAALSALSRAPCAKPALAPATPRPAAPRVAGMRRTNKPVRQTTTAALPLAGLAAALGTSAEVLLTGGVFTLAAGAAGAWYATSNAGQKDGASISAEAEVEAEPQRAPPSDAVLVFGASGKTGREAVAALLRSGRDVVAAVRDETKLEAALADLQGGAALAEAERTRLFVCTGVDITNAATLSPSLFQGVTQVVTALGPIFGKLPEGGFGYFDNMTSERVDAEGVANVVEACKRELPAQRRTATPVMKFASEEDLAQWIRLDDVIMGGNSSSSWELKEGHAEWGGELVVAGGGFCGTRSVELNANLAAYDGISLRVRGDGQRYKINVKTAYNADMPEFTYQAAFDTVAGEWTTVDLPFDNFLAVRKGNEIQGAPPLDATMVSTLGLILSRFEFNGAPNPRYREGQFTFAIESISGFKRERPQLVHMSSGGVERNARIETAEQRKNCVMPIVQLNPGGTLNWKYEGETAVRRSGLLYSVVRSSGLVTEDLDKSFVLEGLQGDRTTGKISRGEVGQVLAAAVGTPEAIEKTFEVRRGDEENAELQHSMKALFYPLAKDTDRAALGLPPFPAPGPPMGMPDEERKQEILKDERVVASMKRGDGGRIRGDEEAPSGTSRTEDDTAAAAERMAKVRAEEAIPTVEVKAVPWWKEEDVVMEENAVKESVNA